MATETHLAARQFRLQQWTAMVQECNSRPAGMKITEWCREHGITKDAYYYPPQLRQKRPAWIPMKTTHP